MSVTVTPAANRSPYRGYRFPPEIIAHAVWLYFRFHLSFRDVQALLAERGISVSHESIRQWCAKFGPLYAAGLRRRRVRAVDQNGIVLDILVPSRRAQQAAERFLRQVLEGEDGTEPRVAITDKRASSPPAHPTGAAQHRSSPTPAVE